MLANVVCWSVIAMLKENIFLVIAFSALAVLAALKLNEKCCSTKMPKDLESNQEKEKPDQPVIVRSEAGLQEEEPVESKVEPPAGQRHNQTEAEISPETQLREGCRKKNRISYGLLPNPPPAPPPPPGMVFLRIKKFTPIFFWKLNL